jgi:hypothetical protein
MAWGEMPAVEFLGYMDCDPVKSSSAYGKPNEISICGVGVNRAEFSGLFDLPVTSELADDMWYDICEALGYILADRL